MRGGGGAGRGLALRARLRDVRPAARRPAVAAVDLPRGVGLQAVRGLRGRAAGAGRQAVARRRRAETHPRAPQLRPHDHASPPDLPHQRHSRPVGTARDGRVALPGRPFHAGRRARHRQPAEGAQLQPGRRVPLQQLRLLAPGDDGATCVGEVAAGVQRRADLQAVRHGAHARARRSRDDRPRAHECLRGRSRRVEDQHPFVRYARRHLALHHGWRPPQVAAQLRGDDGGDAGAHEGCAHLGGAQQREAGQLRLRHLDREVPRDRGLRPWWGRCRLSCRHRALPAAPPRGRRRVQLRGGHPQRLFARGGGRRARGEARPGPGPVGGGGQGSRRECVALGAAGGDLQGAHQRPGAAPLGQGGDARHRQLRDPHAAGR